METTKKSSLPCAKIIRKAYLKANALDHRFRMQILSFLHDCEDRGATVTELYIKFRVEQPVMSQHLSILRRAEYVKTERDGKNIYYFVSPAFFEVNEKFAAL
jgi:DNA-binding transcriptional ArsR family regulator